MDRLQSSTAGIQKTRPVITVCASGVRSVHALMAAQQAGLDITGHYKGGFKDWYGAGETIA